LHALCYPLAVALQVVFVVPFRTLRHRPRGRGVAAALPLKTYADYPFSVLVNDQSTASLPRWSAATSSRASPTSKVNRSGSRRARARAMSFGSWSIPTTRRARPAANRDTRPEPQPIGLVLIAHDLLAWTQTLALTGQLARCEPKRLRSSIVRRDKLGRRRDVTGVRYLWTARRRAHARRSGR
jgi:hypothetical protein